MYTRCRWDSRGSDRSALAWEPLAKNATLALSNEVEAPCPGEAARAQTPVHRRGRAWRRAF